MNYLCVGDEHIRFQRPENRIDDFFFTQYEKIKWIFQFAKEHEAVILKAGDLFDSPKASHYLTSTYIDLYRKYRRPVFAVAGQHDLRYHTDLKNSPFNVLLSAGLIKHASSEPFDCEETHIYGADWGQNVPKIKSKDYFNILIIHRMIIPSKKEKLWEGQTDYTLADSLLGKGFDLIVSGDNHRGFIIDSHKGTLINCGSVMRMTKAQINHKPFVVLYNTMAKEYKQVFIPTKPAKVVFDLKKLEEDKEHDEKIEAFVKGLNEHKDMGLSFQDNLREYGKKNKVDKKIMMIIEEAMNESDSQGID